MCNYFTKLCHAVVILLCAVIYACSPSEKSNQQQIVSDIALPGWVYVSFGLDSEYLQANKGMLIESYDEFVGGLVDDGLVTDNSRWLKPTYGNDNLLWTLSAALGNIKILALDKSKQEFSSSGYVFEDGAIDIVNIKWRYSGYSIQTEDIHVPSFKSYVYVCGASNKGVSLFYWGDGGVSVPHKDESVLKLMEQLSRDC